MSNLQSLRTLCELAKASPKNFAIPRHWRWIEPLCAVRDVIVRSVLDPKP